MSLSPAFDDVVTRLKRLPGLGFRSAERIALHLLIEEPDALRPLLESLQSAAAKLKACPITGNLTEGETCPIWANPQRDRAQVCVVEQVPDLLAVERAGAFRGVYHVLHGKLSPLRGIGPDKLNLGPLRQRLEAGEISELILALGNDIEGEATCHYVQDELLAERPDVTVSRIGFGLPSGSGLTFADAATLKSALEGRRSF
ncbi:MAG: recombination mediator RecR [Opitutales bacterium]